MEHISIIIPVVRWETANDCMDAIYHNAGIDHEFIEVLAIEDTKQIGCPKMVKDLVEMTTYDNVMFLGDDTIPEIDFA